MCISIAMGRPLRIIQTQYPYHLVTRTNNRTFRFDKRKVTRIFFTALAQAAEKYNVSIHHVVLMTNHYHIAAWFKEDNLDRFMQYLNARTAYRYNRTVGRTGHLWGERYHSCIVADDEHYLHTVRYLYRNPIRAGMVPKLEQYQESSFQAWAFGKKIDVILTPDHIILNMGNDKRRVAWFFMALVMDKGDSFPSDSSMKAALSKTVYGPVGFKERFYVN
jgi:REP element-mobilizing transposase RayT